MFRLSCDVHVLILCPIKVEYVHSEQYVQGIIYTPTGGGTPPIDVIITPKLCYPHWGVCTVLVVYSYTA